MKDRGVRSAVVIRGSIAHMSTSPGPLGLSQCRTWLIRASGMYRRDIDAGAYEIVKDRPPARSAPPVSDLIAVDGNSSVLTREQYVVDWPDGCVPTDVDLAFIERDVESAVLDGRVTVLTTDLPEAVLMRAGVVPLRWGAPRLIVATDCEQGRSVRAAIADGTEAFAAWSLWRHTWDPLTDLLAETAPGGAA